MIKKFFESKSIINYLFILMLIVNTCNVVFETVIDNLNLYSIAIFLVYFIIIYVLSIGKKRPIIYNEYILFMLFLIFVNIIKTMLKSGIKVSIVGSGVYLIIILLWSMVYSKYFYEFNINNYINNIILIAVIVAVFGIYQYFFDASLFGLMSKFRTYYTEDVKKIMDVYRSSSFMSSIQVYSLYMGISLSLLLEKYKTIKMKNIYFCILLLGGIVSGSKVFVLPILIFVIIKCMALILKNRYKMSNILLGILYLLLIFVLFKFMYIFAPKVVNRIFLPFIDNNEFNRQELNRLGIMSTIFKQDAYSIIAGNGYGSSFKEVNNILNIGIRRITTESMYGSIWYECGVLMCFSYVMLFVYAIIGACKDEEGVPITLLSLSICCIFSPAFWSLSLMSVWGIVIYYLYCYKLIKIQIRSKKVC